MAEGLIHANSNGDNADTVWSATLAANDDAPGAARALIEHLRGYTELGGTRLTELQVAVSELVTNAVLHAPPGRIEVLMWLRDGTVRIEVADGGTATFEPPRELRESGGGWGLHLVEMFMDRSGIDHRPHTVAWFELDLV